MNKQRYTLCRSLCLAVSMFLAVSLITPIPARAIDPTQPVQQNDFRQLDPLNIGGSSDIGGQDQPSAVASQLNTPGGVLSRVLQFAIPLAGLILFVMIVWGGFEMLSGAATAKSKDAGRQRITAALIGFFILFSAYWIAQIIQVVFGIKFLS